MRWRDGEDGDQQAGERDDRRVALHFEIGFAEKALDGPNGPLPCAVLNSAISAPANAASDAPRVPHVSAISGDEEDRRIRERHADRAAHPPRHVAAEQELQRPEEQHARDRARR